MTTYAKAAQSYDLIYAALGKDYEKEAAEVRETIQRFAASAKTLLDVGCGTGRHLECLRRWYQVEGLDRSQSMLAIARRRLPEVALHNADLEEFKLAHRFDAVLCLFSSIAYVKTPEHLRAAVANLAQHVTAGGVLIIDGWIEPEDWHPGRVLVTVAQDGPQRVVRMSYSSQEGRVSIMDWHYLVGGPEGIDHFTERHLLGLFTRDEYVQAMDEAGLAVRVLEAAAAGRERYIGIMPNSRGA